MSKKDFEEYHVLTEKLQKVEWAIEGDCNDIDCDKYVHRDLLKKRFKPVLEHNFSCMGKLKKEKEALMRILSTKKYKKFRYKKCTVCKKNVDTLNPKSKIVTFTRPDPANKKYYEVKLITTHKNCESEVKIPEGWKKS